MNNTFSLMYEDIRKLIFYFQMQVDKKLQELFQSCLDRGHKKEDFVLEIHPDNIYYLTFNGKIVEIVKFKHEFTVEGKSI